MSTVAAPAGCAPHGAAAHVYRCRRPERTMLYGLVQRHLQNWLAESQERDPDSGSIAPYIERELRDSMLG
jgi:hypothetical protein